MSAAQTDPSASIACLLEEGLRIGGELCRLEEKIQPLLIAMDPRGLSALVEAGAEIMHRGEQLIEQKRKLAGERPLHELIELLPDAAAHRYVQLREKLSEIKAGQELNRCLIEGGAPLIHRLHQIMPSSRGTYDRCGELCSPAGGVRAGFDQNC